MLIVDNFLYGPIDTLAFFVMLLREIKAGYMPPFDIEIIMNLDCFLINNDRMESSSVDFSDPVIFYRTEHVTGS